ncbi:hypothetical protein CJ177_10500 [Rhodococcus sp. ACPA1]|nr:hypothetical protein CJ177_10500 [Rhodococcus sp. ACPA1]
MTPTRAVGSAIPFRRSLAATQGAPDAIGRSVDLAWWHVPVPGHFRGMQPDNLPAASAAFTCRSALGEIGGNA